MEFSGMERNGTGGEIFSNNSKYSRNIFTCKRQSELDILTGGGRDSEVLVGPRGRGVGLVAGGSLVVQPAL